jgi:hypothetical protein
MKSTFKRRLRVFANGDGVGFGAAGRIYHEEFVGYIDGSSNLPITFFRSQIDIRLLSANKEKNVSYV